MSRACARPHGGGHQSRGVHGLSARPPRRLQLSSARRNAPIRPRAADSHVAASDQSHHRAARSAGLPRATSRAEKRAPPHLSHPPYLGMVKVVHATLLEIQAEWAAEIGPDRFGDFMTT